MIKTINRSNFLPNIYLSKEKERQRKTHIAIQLNDLV
jgi:hypothetical protein